MSMTKTFYHDTICEQMTEDYYEMYYRSHQEEFMFDETAFDWFPDYRLAHDGYQEFECQLCSHFNTINELHNECIQQEEFWAEEFSY